MLIHGPESELQLDSDCSFVMSLSLFVRLFCNLLNNTDVGTPIFCSDATL